MWLLFAVFFLTFSLGSFRVTEPIFGAVGPIIRTSYGKLEGFQYIMTNGERANVFLGLPYAEPPVGQLRFEKPVPVAKWKGVRQAKKLGNICFQQSYRRLMVGPGEISEDCLYMNIHAPAKRSPNPEGYPVLLFIHGGGFVSGSANYFNYQNISENFVSQGIVFVTINYRLSAYGFFSTGDEVARGNYGYWDQTRALKFIHDIIADFGGNPNLVTVSGESAGAASTSALSLSPHSNWLLHRAITFSGSQYSNFANYSQVVTASLQLATAVGCSGSSQQMKSCMKLKTADEIRNGIFKIGPGRDEFMGIMFNPTIDGEFLPAPADQLVKTAPKIPYMAGVTDAEGGFSAYFDLPEMFTPFLMPHMWSNLTAAQFKNYLWNKFITGGYENDISLKSSVIWKVIKFYITEGAPNQTPKELIARYIDLCTDLFFALPVYQEVQDKVAAGMPSYMFLEEYHNPIMSAPFPVRGAFHGNEMPYLLGAFFPNLDFTFDDNDKKFQRDLISAMVSFAQTGTPVVSGKRWDPVTKEHPNRYMSFDTNSQMKDGFLKESMDFWLKDVMGGADIDMLRETIAAGARRPQK
ncbi:hypothetical protein QR680_010228 [Steinernema hermaphroditum]|uniref:Carboxylic ester hydrolase n=1 Tax=Steinernema hermaphroditum TaxID=289476 RepID=A0AA39MBE7_9BILA|nr:hypothetical protein QR680_010228 [Steinernema hermaphroditum]